MIAALVGLFADLEANDAGGQSTANKLVRWARLAHLPHRGVGRCRQSSAGVRSFGWPSARLGP